MTRDNEYGALRVKTDTIESLKDLKAAFEVSYGRKFTNDEFIRQMAASVEEGDPGVWEIYCRIQTTQKELEVIAAESRKQREEQR